MTLTPEREAVTELVAKGTHYQRGTPPPDPEREGGGTEHPLARFIDIDGKVRPPRWVIPGFIAQGVVVIAGSRGVGKTTAMLPLALVAAGLHGGELMPRHWRHVVYITEDSEQARRILTGVVEFGGLGINMADVRERFHLVDAVRLDPDVMASVGGTYREQLTRSVAGTELLPLVVIDTKAAVLAMKDENDNAEASAMMATLKQGFAELPVWLVGHVAKANLGRTDAATLTTRGADAVEADANQTIFLIQEQGPRYLVQGKHRFEPKWPELEITSQTASTVALDEFGNAETVVLRWGMAAPPGQSRKEATEQAVEAKHRADENELRQEILEAVETGWRLGNPLNRAGLKAKVKRKASQVVAAIENLVAEQWLIEVSVPPKLRLVNSRSAFLVALDAPEHDVVMAGGEVPVAKLAIPPTWQKPKSSPVPASQDESEGDGHE